MSVIEKLSRDSDDWQEGKFRLVRKPTQDSDHHASEYFKRYINSAGTFLFVFGDNMCQYHPQ